MSSYFTFNIETFVLDENYQPSQTTRATTNFANLARGKNRKQNLQNVLTMIDNSFNALAHWDNDGGDRYAIELEVVSVYIAVNGHDEKYPSIEMLKTNIIDKKTNKRTQGIVGNNFSSYVRDYDFSIRLPEHNKGQSSFSVPEDFGHLHGEIFKTFVNSDTYQQNFNSLPVICLSVSDNKIYKRTENHHPVLGFEYLPNETSLTEQYFKKMGPNVRYFMPPNSVSPLAFYFFGDLLNDYTNLQLISTISTMGVFQKIYRPEIYNANAVAGKCFTPRLTNNDYSLTKITYDREERTQLAIQQGKFAEENFIKPYGAILDDWLAGRTVQSESYLKCV